jgi:hypothetical protein
MKAGLTVALGIAGMFAALSGRAAPFAKDWAQAWTPVLEVHDSVIRRVPGGALEVDATPGKHVYHVGGEKMRDVRVTARIKFLRADAQGEAAQQQVPLAGLADVLNLKG